MPAKQPSSSTKFAVAFIFIFGLPFALSGLYCAYQAFLVLAYKMPSHFFQQSRWPHDDWRVGALLAIFALAFGGVGFLLIFGALFGGKKLSQDEKRRQDEPLAPWLWREDWASGRMRSQTRGQMAASWGFAIFWNLISAPCLFFLPEEVFQKHNHLAALGFLFPLVGIGLFIAAIRKTLQHFKFGTVFFEMAKVPGVIGGWLNGQIVLNRLLACEHFYLELHCLQRETRGSGKNRSTSEKIIWETSQTFSRQNFLAGAGQMSLPVSIQIPYECVQSEHLGSGDDILWQLVLSASVPGIDFAARFEIPVFKTPESDPQLNEANLQKADASLETLQPELMANMGIKIESVSQGTRFYFAAARNPGAAFSLGVFFAIWTAALVLQLKFKVPLIFPIVTGLFELLLFYFLIDLTLGTSNVLIGQDSIQSTNGYFGGGKTRIVPFTEVKDFVLVNGMQSSGKVYYDLKLLTQSDKKIYLGRYLSNKRVAQSLARQMRGLIKPDA